jgi:hypothetical protein
MKIAEGQLRLIIREAILLEGFKDDQRWLINKYPEHAQDLSALQPKWIALLTTRFGESTRISEDQSFEDAIVTVRNFSRKETAIPQKYRDSEQFRNAFDGRFPGISPNDPTKMTVDDLKKILGFLELKKQRIDVNEAGDIKEDRIGKVGPWNLFMPTTRENSCKIVSDPITGEPNVNWCTASTTKNNPFYGYVAGPSSKMILFTLVRDNSKGDKDDFLSLGFQRSKLVTSNREASITVDGTNMGLSLPKIRSILGSDFDEIMRILNEKVQSLSGVHPAIKKFEDASKSLSALEYFLRGLGGQEAVSSKKSIAEQAFTTEEVLIHLSADKSEDVRRTVAENLNLPVEFLEKLSSDPSAEVRIGVANNKKITPDIAKQLSNDTSLTVRYAIVYNPKTDSSTLARLASDENESVRAAVASNPKTSPTVLANLINDKEEGVAASAVRNQKTPIDAVIDLSKSQDETRRSLALQSKDLPKDVLVDLSKDPSYLVRRSAVSSEAMRSIDLLSLFLNDENPEIRFTASYHIKKLEKKSKNIKSENLLRELIKRMQ